ncbi:integral membrane protein [Talaromyces pinophilus]|uniref:Integral membrane protein n=1 Tax=Talaromyces pinophilus TaxID=128442 RepID=A0A510NX36_TALPI|nr:integral membrane protein [Talaromyces pinophilus]
MRMEVTSAGTGFLVLIWVLTVMSLLIVGLRIVAKVKINQFRLDDVLMITALVMGIVAAVLNTIGVHYGYGHPDETVPEPYASLARKYYIIGQAVLIGCTAMGRAAFIAYLMAILGSQKWQRIILISLAVMELIFNLVSIILIFGTCKPLAVLWDYTITGTCSSADIQIYYGYFQSIFNVLIDLYLAVVPTYIFWHLKLKVAIKLSLIGLMSCGLVAMGAALAKTIQLQEINNEPLGGTMKLIRWGYIEAHLVMITASIPCLRSLILSGFHYVTSSGQQSRSYELGAAFTGTRRGITTVTAHNNSQHRRTDSRLRSMLSNRNNDDGASAHHILESRNSIDAVKSSESSQDLRNGSIGIQKQVDVTITMHNHSSEDEGGFKQ